MNFLIGIWRKSICVGQGNRTINSLSHKDFIHLSETGLPGWGFYHFTRSGDDRGLGPLHLLTTVFHMEAYLISNIKHCYYIYIFHYNLLSVLLFSFIFLKKALFYFSIFLFSIKRTTFVRAHACKWNISCSTIDLSDVLESTVCWLHSELNQIHTGYLSERFPAQ